MYRYTTFEEEEKRKEIKGRVLSVLEFDKIREKLISCASTCYGKDMASKLNPTSGYSFVFNALNDTEEAFTYINKYGPLPLSGFCDLNSVISYAEAGGVLSLRQLLDVAIFLKSVDRLSKVISNEHSDMQDTNLFGAISALDGVSSLVSDIDFCIVNDEEVNDRASDTLYSIRREKKEIQQNIRVLLDRVIRNNEDALQESIITIRADRYCVPVKVECKGRIPGIIHDSSSTGQTVFIEPLSVVEANNRIRELLGLEREEIERILEALTSKVLRNKDSLISDMALVGKIDFVSAKGKLAFEMDAVKPALNQNGVVRFNKARHPLIDKNAVVPVDIEIGDKYKSLIITGPNTGGKTVSLKTCGLLTAMCMAGLMIPCAVGSEAAVFDKILADIGDEQSIEQSLSTFSAHMSNIVFILKNVRGKSLVLLDELGSGTDPNEGASLAIAILDELFNKDCVTMATTHYKELKAYAIEKEGVINGSFEFDTETLSPTYRLIIGVPGSSNAFIISQKLGLPKRIIDEAMTKLSTSEFSYERLLEEAEENRKVTKKLRTENEELNLELTRKKEELEEEYKKLKQSKTKILNDSRAEQKAIIEEKQEELDALIKELRIKSKNQRKEDMTSEMEKVRMRLRAGVKDLTDDSNDDALDVKSMPGEVPNVIEEGGTYYVPHLDMLCRCVSKPNKNGKVQIESGNMKLTVEKDALRVPSKSQLKGDDNSSGKQKVNRKVPVKKDVNMEIAFEKAVNTMPELMLIGKRADEAQSALESYIDDCSMTAIKKIRIVHGKGTGALRSVVDSCLRADSRVKSHRLGTVGEGEDGVTIAELY